MCDTLRFILAITCAIPAVAGVKYFRKIYKRYYPLIFIAAWKVPGYCIYTVSIVPVYASKVEKAGRIAVFIGQAEIGYR
jgi:hypothetical protein